MPERDQIAFTFTSKALEGDTFTVAGFQGREGLSQLYRYDITLVSREEDLDLESVLAEQATLTTITHGSDGEVEIPVHGILESLDQMHQVGDFTFYRAVLRPRLWWLTLTRHNQIFLGKTLPQFLEAVLQDGGLSSGTDFEIKLSGDYKEWEYICQYQESHFNFVSHWLERYGIYYYFVHDSGTDKLIITDTKMAHGPMPQGRTFSYSPISGLEAPHRGEIVNSFICSQRPMPKSVLVKDYNYERPDLSMEASAEISSQGRGQLYFYGDHFRSLEEGRALAQIRAEEQLCRKQVFHGESTVPCIRPGYSFTLQGHYRGDLNADYLTTEVWHEGNQETYLRSELDVPLQPAERSVSYRNSLTAIPAGVQFRPERVTEKPRFHGSMNAKIDAEGSGDYAELDEQGRYKVVLPFDRSGRGDGKASCRLRMMQPYSGPDHGMHFPLHKGCEVVLNFIDGDPDRPIIAGAAPNPDNPSQITDQSQTKAKLTTSGGNKLHIEDQQGSQRMTLQSPTARSSIRLGAPESPAPHSESGNSSSHGDKDSSHPGIKLVSLDHLHIKVNAENKVILGEKSTTVFGLTLKNFLVGKEQGVFGYEVKINSGWERQFTPLYTELHGSHNEVSENKTESAEAKQTSTGENVEANASKNQFNESKQDANGNKLVTNGSNESIAGNNTNTSDTSENINGNSTTVSGMAEAIEEIQNKISEMDNRLSASEQKIKENKTEISGVKSDMYEENAMVGEFFNNIAGLQNNI